MRPLHLLCISLVAAVDYSFGLYSDSACTSMFFAQNETSDGTCDEVLADEISACEVWVEEQSLDDDSICESIALNTCYTNDYVENSLAGGFPAYMYIDCVDEVPEPTSMPTEATCDDGMQNGNETGVDCGGTDCDQCPESCSTFDCTSYGEQYALADDAGDNTCEVYPCSAVDIDTCCITRATCFTLSSCLSGDVLVSDSNLTYCEDSECNTFDRDVCCTAAGNCTNFDLCDEETQYLNADPELLTCDSEVCGEADISKCCSDKGTCDSYTCDFNAGLTAVNDSDNVYCSLSTCSDDDSVVCCTDRASCAPFVCDVDQFVDKSDKDSTLCTGSTCTDSDNYECCDEKQACQTINPAYTYPCPSDLDLVVNPEDVFCSNTSCTSEDQDTCCPLPTEEPTPSPTPSPTTSPTASPTMLVNQQSGGGGVACFSMDGVVETLTRGSITLGDLKTGDFVRDSSNGYTKVVGFLHHDVAIEYDFLELTTNAGKIVVTGEHLLRTKKGFIKGKHVEPGMRLMSVNNFQQKVIGAVSVTRTGVIAPLTESGVLSVNGIQVSCYAYVPGQLHWLVDLVMWPRKHFVWSQDGIDSYALAMNVIFYLPWKFLLMF